MKYLVNMEWMCVLMILNTIIFCVVKQTVKYIIPIGNPSNHEQEENLEILNKVSKIVKIVFIAEGALVFSVTLTLSIAGLII